MTGSSPDDRTKSRLVEVLRWFMFTDRPPGMPGTAVKINTHGNSDATLMRRPDNTWVFVDDNGTEATIGASEVTELISTRRFVPLTVEIRPGLAPILFQEAIARTSDSVAKLSQAKEEQASHQGELDPMSFIKISALVDRSLRAGYAGIVLAIAAAEAQVNEWIEDTGGWSDAVEQRGLMERILSLAHRFNAEVETGAGTLQELKRSIEQRNRIVHSSPDPVTYPLTGADSLAPGRSVSMKARRACLAVRSALIEIASIIGEPVATRLTYLAYCPAGDPADDGLWAVAELMTGVREDPDFPTVKETLDESNES